MNCMESNDAELVKKVRECLGTDAESEPEKPTNLSEQLREKRGELDTESRRLHGLWQEKCTGDYKSFVVVAAKTLNRAFDLLYDVLDYADQNGSRKLRFELSLNELDGYLANIETIIEALTTDDTPEWVEPFLIPVQTPEEVQREQLKDDLLNDHWLEGFSWESVDIPELAETYNCRQSEVQGIMKEIEAEHPAPDWEGFRVAITSKEVSTGPYDVFKLGREFHITDTTEVIAFHKKVLAEMEAKRAESEVSDPDMLLTLEEDKPNWIAG